MGTKIVYNHKAIEKKWREKWEETPVNPRNGKDGNKKPKYYCLDMFPYPSGNGLHVGHWRGYVISDVWSRYKLQQGYYIVHPMGWDAFGLPAENYAIKMGVHPAKSTEANITNIKRQINDIAALYDWDMEVNTTDPEFYKWTQWIFVKMFKEGLAYEKEFPINWCPSCKTGLANEEVVNGKCERCGADVTKKNLRQWMLRITKYADRLLNDLDKLDWPEKVKKMQADWIGKSYGAEVDFPVEGRDEKITVYTTRPDTLHGATFMVLAPEHELAASLATPETKEAVEKYIYDASMKSNVDRMQDKEKTGVFTGSYAINPLNGKKTPIWLSDYVLADYGTGAIMCVPAHDDRDFEFATKFNIPIIQVIAKDGKEIENMTEAYTEAAGTMINSGDWNGMESSVLKKEAPHIIEKMGIGRATVNYKLRDWVFSRQRYWGEPIPIVHCPKCGNVIMLHVSGSEYPQGAINSTSNSIEGATYIEDPRFVVQYAEHECQESLLSKIVSYCDKEYTASEAIHPCSVEQCTHDCKNQRSDSSCNCISCLEEVHYHHINGRRTYNCSNLVNCYGCRYLNKFVSEFSYALRVRDIIKKFSQFRVISIGCGPAPDLMALELFRYENGLTTSLQYRGFD